jgi:hypothetical protein
MELLEGTTIDAADVRSVKRHGETIRKVIETEIQIEIGEQGA